MIGPAPSLSKNRSNFFITGNCRGELRIPLIDHILRNERLE